MSTAMSSGEVREINLIQQAAGGDGDAFGMLFEKHFQTIYNYVLWLCNDPDQAEDLTQETFIRAHKSLGQLGPPWRIKPWLYRLAHNLFIDFARQKKESHPLDPEGPFHSTEESPERQVMFEELSGPVHSALVKMSPNYREALVLREVQGFHYSDIAEVMGVSVDHVKVLLHRARASFKDNYGLRLLMEKPAPTCTVLNEILDAYRDKELTPDQEQMVRDHVKDCPSCMQRKRELAALLLLFRGQPIFNLPKELHRALRDIPGQNGPGGKSQGKGKGGQSGKGQAPSMQKIKQTVAVGALGAGIALAGWLFMFVINNQPEVNPPPAPTQGTQEKPGEGTPVSTSAAEPCGPPNSDCVTPTGGELAAPPGGGSSDETTEALVADHCYCEVDTATRAWNGKYTCATADGVPVSTVVDFTTCPAPVCGNGSVEGIEQCDGGACDTGLACNADCTCPVCTCARTGVCRENPRISCTYIP